MTKAKCLPQGMWKFCELELEMIFFLKEDPTSLYRKISNSTAIGSNDNYHTAKPIKFSSTKKVCTQWDVNQL